MSSITMYVWEEGGDSGMRRRESSRGRRGDGEIWEERGREWREGMKEVGAGTEGEN